MVVVFRQPRMNLNSVRKLHSSETDGRDFLHSEETWTYGYEFSTIFR